MLNIFINRPILSSVISIIIIILGFIGIKNLPIESYPNIAPTRVVVTANYSGADAETVLNTVVVPLEEYINGIEGMTYMTSSASNDGQASIQIYFREDIDPDNAVRIVSNRVDNAKPLLPLEVIQTGVNVQKNESSLIMVIAIHSDNKNYDERFLHNYTEINLVPHIQRVTGVADANVYGGNKYSVRIWFDPTKMALYNLTTNDVISSIQDQNRDASLGTVGSESNQSFEYKLKYKGKLKNIDEFRNIIIKSSNDNILRLKDIAKVELGSLGYKVNSKYMYSDAVAIGITQTPGSNVREVIKSVEKTIKEQEKLFPKDIHISIISNANTFLDESIKNVLKTILEAFLLVIIVVFVFLQSIKATIIPAIAIPVSIIGTFFFLGILGFSINILTLFAIILAIGLVVDDAIVVVEAIYHEMETTHNNKRKATIIAMKKIAPAIISITLVMMSVFIPVSFISGTSGIFFKQFGLTIAVAILISGINALTLSPALSAMFLKINNVNNNNNNLRNRLHNWFEKIFNSGKNLYEKIVRFLCREGKRWISVCIVIGSILLLTLLMKIVPKDFVPMEDSGYVMGVITLPPGSSLERTDSLSLNMLNEIVKIEGVENVIRINGLSFLGGINSSYASVIIRMKPIDERKNKSSDLVSILTKKMNKSVSAKYLFFAMPTIQGFGSSFSAEVNLEDRSSSTDINAFYQDVNNFIEVLNNREEVLNARTNFNPNFPEKKIDLDIEKIKDAGLNISDVLNTMQAYIGSMYISNFNIFGKDYRVIVQADPEFRKKIEDLNNLYVKTSSGKMAPISEFVSIEDVTGPQSINRFNQFRSINLTIIPNFTKGYNIGDIINLMSKLSEKDMPKTISYEYSGLTKESNDNKNQMGVIVILSFIFVYLLIAALYESFILPMAVLLSIPIGLLGVFVFIFIGMINGSGITENIFVQISIIMLIGLLAKNAILIVEYALQRRKKGMSLIDSAVGAATIRLRPILMTSFAFIFGILPLALSSGIGENSNKSIGISAIGGMIFGTLIGILIIPTLFIIFKKIEEKITKTNSQEIE